MILVAGAVLAEREMDIGKEEAGREIGGGRGVGFSCSAGWREK